MISSLVVTFVSIDTSSLWPTRRSPEHVMASRRARMNSELAPHTLGKFPTQTAQELESR